MWVEQEECDSGSVKVRSAGNRREWRRFAHGSLLIWRDDMAIRTPSAGKPFTVDYVSS